MTTIFSNGYPIIAWDIARKLPAFVPFGKDGETGRGFKIRPMQNQTAIVPGEETMRLYAEKPDGTHVYIDAVKDGDAFRIDLTTQVFAVVGTVKAHLELTSGVKTIYSNNFSIIVDANLVDASIESTNEFTALQTALATIQEVDAVLLDLTVNVRKFKTEANTWNEALQSAVNYANTLYASQSEIGGLYVPQNVLVKMPRGRYIITQEIVGQNGLDFDFSGCTFVASPSDKTLKFLNMDGKIFRNRYERGVFVGFHTALLATTNNLDTSNLVWDSPTFQSCLYGIDTVSFNKSRSTFLQILNIYSILTDCPIKAHTDMASVEGGWIYHTGYNGAAIYNQGFMKLVNVICVPSAPQPGARPRWIDNHSEDEGSTGILGERGISIDHCRFGGETGSCPVIFNYAGASLNTADFKATILSIENTSMSSVGTADVSNIVLFALPNRINLKNISGLTDLTERIIQCDPSFDSALIPYSKYISIDYDPTAYNPYGIMPEDLYRFTKTFENANTQWRETFPDGKTQYKYDCVGSATGAKFSFKLKTPISFDTPTDGKLNTVAFFLSLSGESSGASLGYKAHALYFVAMSAYYNGSTVVKKLNYTLIASNKGGVDGTFGCELSSLHWGLGDTGSADQSYTDANQDVTANFASDSAMASAVIIPVHGMGY